MSSILSSPVESNCYATHDGVHLVFVPAPQHASFFLWGARAMLHPLAVFGNPSAMILPDEHLNTRRVRGYSIALLEGIPHLAALTHASLEQESTSIHVWSLAAKLVLEWVTRGCIVPRLITQQTQLQARWSVALGASEDHDRMQALLRAFPTAAHAIFFDAPQTTAKDPTSSARVWTPHALLKNFFDTAADELVRQAVARTAATRTTKPRKKRTAAVTATQTETWPQRLLHALTSHDAHFDPQDAQERGLPQELQQWVRPVLGNAVGSTRLCLQLQLPAEQEFFQLEFSLQATHGMSPALSAGEIFAGSELIATHLNCSVREAQEQLLQGLAIAARSFQPIAEALRSSQPTGVTLKAAQAWQFINIAMPALHHADMHVLLPPALLPEQQQRLSICMCIDGTQAKTHSVLPYHWQAMLAGQPISLSELQELAYGKAPLLQYAGQWVVIDPAELQHTTRLLTKTQGEIGMAAALSLALTGRLQHTDSHLRIDVTTSGDLQQLLQQLQQQEAVLHTPPKHFVGTLRPYQQRGMSWLLHLSQLQFGACLADDMGLGKTIQLLAYLLQQRELHPDDTRPILLVCPTSVLGNWEHECTQFAPSIPVRHHYGPERAQHATAFTQLAPGTLILTSYGLLRRDIEILGAVKWSAVVLDEAQHIKNAHSATARAARVLQASHRITLTGTPMENRLDELWSISEFLNPGLLGSLEEFRREVAMPIERYGRDDIAQKLKRIISPFFLRRLKSDASIIQDLPRKLESKVFCSLTREQATLYQTVLNESLLEIEHTEGIQRRGRVLALLTALKQVCNHPAQYLHEQGPLRGRSGKLDRLCEMLEEILANDERALVFTQYREMGNRLVRRLSQLTGNDVPFLHGGVPRATRAQMVERFQRAGQSKQRHGPHIFVISVKAGGTGLNLTAASHVFHYDRWWNPAVEDQATDRAFRIGQQHTVQVHKLMCAGTVEEKIDQLLSSKRDLAERIVHAGEHWITELDNASLREMLSLAPSAVVEDDELEETPAAAPAPTLSPRRTVNKKSRS